jgi:anti-sigma factor RsiW
MNDDLHAQRVAAEHARCRQLIPWWVNGTLSAEEMSGVEQHFVACVECAAELELQRALQSQLRDGDPVLMAPQSAWQKMAERLDNEDEALARGYFRSGPKDNSAWRWAVAAQALLIVGLTTAVWQQAHSPETNTAELDTLLQPRYVTLTSGAAVATDGAVRVVFRQDVTLAEVNALMRELSTQIVAGPTEAGVYTLAWPSTTTVTTSAEQATVMLKNLRADARVVFAEPAEQR